MRTFGVVVVLGAVIVGSGGAFAQSTVPSAMECNKDGACQGTILGQSFTSTHDNKGNVTGMFGTQRFETHTDAQGVTTGHVGTLPIKAKTEKDGSTAGTVGGLPFAYRTDKKTGRISGTYMGLAFDCGKTATGSVACGQKRQ